MFSRITRVSTYVDSYEFQPYLIYAVWTTLRQVKGDRIHMENVTKY